MLDDASIWPPDGRAAGLREDLEHLIGNLEAIEAGMLGDYLSTLVMLRQHMPAEIGRLKRGMLTEAALGSREFAAIREEHPGLTDDEALARWHSLFGKYRGN
jgi:hypothetical protein